MSGVVAVSGAYTALEMFSDPPIVLPDPEIPADQLEACEKRAAAELELAAQLSPLDQAQFDAAWDAVPSLLENHIKQTGCPAMSHRINLAGTKIVCLYDFPEGYTTRG